MRIRRNCYGVKLKFLTYWNHANIKVLWEKSNDHKQRETNQKLDIMKLWKVKIFTSKQPVLVKSKYLAIKKFPNVLPTNS